MQRGEEEYPSRARRAAVLTQADEYMSVKQLEQGQAEWEHFAENYSMFRNDPLIYSMAIEVSDGRPLTPPAEPFTGRL